VDEFQLRNFLMICKCSSITEAADRLGIAQPSLSQQLLRLEDEFGTALFRRTSRGVVATDAGRLLQEHAITILRAMGRAREEVPSTQSIPHGDVNFGMPGTASLLLSVPLLVAARSSLPQVNLRIHETMSGTIRRWLEEARIELAILYDAEGARHLSAKPVARETLFLVGPPDAFGPSDEQGVAIEPADPGIMATRDFILPSVSHGLRKLVERRLGAGHVNIAVRIEIDSLAHTKTLIASGMGYSLLSQAAISGELARGELSAARVAGIDLSRSISFVRNPAHPVTRASVEVEDIATNLMREMIREGRWIAELASDD
jgi:LysR family nitrogen assimilation transcriptional regulator